MAGREVAGRIIDPLCDTYAAANVEYRSIKSLRELQRMEVPYDLNLVINRDGCSTSDLLIALHYSIR